MHEPFRAIHRGEEADAKPAVVADAGSADATAEVADFAGCRFISSKEPVGIRLKSAAATTRAPWLLFLRAGTVPQAGWIEATGRFMQATDMREGAACAGVFRPIAATDYMRPRFGEILALLRVTFGGSPQADQGLLIARRFYQAVGGHDASVDAEAQLLRRLGRRRMAMLPAAISVIR